MNFSKKKLYSNIVIALFVIVIPLVNFNHHKYASEEGVIEWDIKSYYAYLPATFIYNDLSLSFLYDNEYDLGKWIWPVTTPTGKQAILTTMGLSFLYAPFFFIAHAVSLVMTQYEPSGYSYPYHVALQFSTYIYFVLALLFLRKILSRYFGDKVIAYTLFVIGAGTNLFYYVGYSAPMPHGYNFFLIVLFIFFLENWTKKMSVKDTIMLGLISGLVTLIRPTNIIVLFLIPLWHVGNWKDLKDRIILFIKKWQIILLMAAAFILIWAPQFAYWKYVSDSFFYFSYGERNDRFYFENPQIWKVLFSYEKGWFVYTPIMLIACFGFWSLFKKKVKLYVPILVYVSVMVYVLSSWWCWWFGGSFGQRSMVDFYGLMAIPLAAIIDGSSKRKIYKYIFPIFLFVLISFNQFNILQYRNGAISYWWTNKEGYWENFLKLHPSCKYWNVLMHPDYEKARLGIYEAIAPFDSKKQVTDEMLVDRFYEDNITNTFLLDSLRSNISDAELTDSLLLMDFGNFVVRNGLAESYFKKIKIDLYLNEINSCATWKKEIEKKAKKREINFDELALLEAERIYKNYSQKYDQR